MLNVTFLIRKRFRSLLVRSELFGINMRYQEVFEKAANIIDEGETICIFFFFEQYDIPVSRPFLYCFCLCTVMLIIHMSKVL